MARSEIRWKEVFQPNLVHWLASDQSYRDVTFICKGEELNFHQSFLSLHSPFLKTLIEKQPCSLKNNVIITLDDVDPNILKKFMKVLYTGCCVAEPREKPDILNLMEMMGIKVDITFQLIGQNELDEIMIDIEMEHLKVYDDITHNFSPITLEKIGSYAESFVNISTSNSTQRDRDCSHDMNISEIQGSKNDSDDNLDKGSCEIIKSSDLSAMSNESNSVLENAIIVLPDTSLENVPDVQSDQCQDQDGNDFEILREFSDCFPDTNYTLSDYFSIAERRVSLELSRVSDNFLNSFEAIENVDYSRDLFATYFEELARKNIVIDLTGEENPEILSLDIIDDTPPSTKELSPSPSPIKSLMTSSNSINLQMMTTNFSIEEIPESPVSIKSSVIGSTRNLKTTNASKSSTVLPSYSLPQSDQSFEENAKSASHIKSSVISSKSDLQLVTVSNSSAKLPSYRLTQSSKTFEEMSKLSSSIKSSVNSSKTEAQLETIDSSSYTQSQSVNTFEKISETSSLVKSSVSSSKSELDLERKDNSSVELPSISLTQSMFTSSIKSTSTSSKNDLQLANIDYSRDLFTTYLEELARKNCGMYRGLDNPCDLSIDLQDDQTLVIEETPAAPSPVKYLMTSSNGTNLQKMTTNVSIEKTHESPSSIKCSVPDSRTDLQSAKSMNSFVEVPSYSLIQSANPFEEMSKSTLSIKSSATSSTSDLHLSRKDDSCVGLSSCTLTPSANTFDEISKSSSPIRSSVSSSNDLVLTTKSNSPFEMSSYSPTQSTNPFDEISKSTSIIKSKSPSTIKSSDLQLATTDDSSVESPSYSLTQSANGFEEISKSSSSIKYSDTSSKNHLELATTGNSSVELPSCILTKSANTFPVKRKLQSRKTRLRKMQQAQSSQAEKMPTPSVRNEENSVVSENVLNKDRLPCDICLRTFANTNTLEVHRNKFH